MEWYPSLTARQTVNVFVLSHIALPSPDDTKKKIDGVFVAIGTASSSDLARKLGVKIEEKTNNIVVNEKMETNMPGLYACGDCTGGLYQISKAVYEGTKAGLQVVKMSH